MDWNSIYVLIEPRLLVVLAFCWALGFIIKSVPGIPDWSIVFIITAFSLLVTIWMMGLSAEAFIQGVLVGAFAVFGNQVIKQAKKGADTDADA
ncbi:phage holin family protein [Paenibacillus sp. 7516]|uniref:phage holin family protein n=1 Tax=Paenibacillus sp. 7516 TaxID=2022549 RepID=UPI000BA6A648|nr:phage holin family protein [Paenibacillus sp. 7516]PAF31848.1 hypothetical protein CHI14_09345 [Paenibacillus sp. 7516]